MTECFLARLPPGGWQKSTKVTRRERCQKILEPLFFTFAIILSWIPEWLPPLGGYVVSQKEWLTGFLEEWGDPSPPSAVGKCLPDRGSLSALGTGCGWNWTRATAPAGTRWTPSRSAAASWPHAGRRAFRDGLLLTDQCSRKPSGYDGFLHRTLMEKTCSIGVQNKVTPPRLW